jgi:hypothetical protein
MRGDDRRRTLVLPARADAPTVDAGRIDGTILFDARPSNDMPAPLGMDTGVALVVDGGVAVVDALTTSGSKNDAGPTAIDAVRVADAAKDSGSSGGCSCELARLGETWFGPVALGLLALVSRRRKSRSRTTV